VLIQISTSHSASFGYIRRSLVIILKIRRLDFPKLITNKLSWNKWKNNV